MSGEDKWSISLALNKESEYRNLQCAMNRLRWMRWDDCEEERLVAIEARAFRLLATLRRLELELVYAEAYPDAWAKWVEAGRKP